MLSIETETSTFIGFNLKRAPNINKCKDVRSLKIAHFDFGNILEIKNIYDLDKNFYGNSHCVNAFQASRYLCFGQKNYFQVFSVRRLESGQSL